MVDIPSYQAQSSNEAGANALIEMLFAIVVFN